MNIASRWTDGIATRDRIILGEPSGYLVIFPICGNLFISLVLRHACVRHVNNLIALLPVWQACACCNSECYQVAWYVSGISCAAIPVAVPRLSLLSLPVCRYAPPVTPPTFCLPHPSHLPLPACQYAPPIPPLISCLSVCPTPHTSHFLSVCPTPHTSQFLSVSMPHSSHLSLPVWQYAPPLTPLTSCLSVTSHLLVSLIALSH